MWAPMKQGSTQNGLSPCAVCVLCVVLVGVPEWRPLRACTHLEPDLFHRTKWIMVTFEVGVVTLKVGVVTFKVGVVTFKVGVVSHCMIAFIKTNLVWITVTVPLY